MISHRHLLRNPSQISIVRKVGQNWQESQGFSVIADGSGLHPLPIPKGPLPMRSIFTRLGGSHVGVVLRLVLGGTFLWSGMTKIVNPGQFATLVLNYQVFPSASIVLIAVVLPWLEVVCGALMVANRLTSGGALLLSAMLVAFIGLHIANLARGIDIACGCLSLSPDARSQTWVSIATNVLLLGISLSILASGRARCRKTA